MYNVLYTRINMIVAIIKIESELSAVEECRTAIDELTAVSDFCNEYDPALNVEDYLGVNASSIDLQDTWGWDFSKATPVLERIAFILNLPLPFDSTGSNDYNQFRDYRKSILNTKTWENLSNYERDFTIQINIKEDAITESQDATNKITHLITTGQATTTEEARIIMVDNWGDHHLLDIESCRARAIAVDLYVKVGTYLNRVDYTDFFLTVENLYFAFRDQGIKGTNDGSETGVFDYIESTPGTVYEFAGLASKGYTMQNGDPDMTNFIISIMDIMRHGKYEPLTN